MNTVYLNVPYNGYTCGILTGNISNYKKEIVLPNGLSIWLYNDEFTTN